MKNTVIYQEAQIIARLLDRILTGLYPRDTIASHVLGNTKKIPIRTANLQKTVNLARRFERL